MPGLSISDFAIPIVVAVGGFGLLDATNSPPQQTLAGTQVFSKFFQCLRLETMLLQGLLL